jgi:hypothetical protein
MISRPGHPGPPTGTAVDPAGDDPVAVDPVAGRTARLADRHRSHRGRLPLDDHWRWHQQQEHHRNHLTRYQELGLAA